MELNVDIDPEQINKMVADAVLESALGEAVKKTIAEQVKSISSSYNNPLESVIRKYMQDMVEQVLIKDYGKELKAKVNTAVASKITDDFIGKIIESGFRNY